mmetsp:Transcript_45580/g.85505  ORF Transcript_45580/g.85505 Transcript_45580/m.85505 type:complete len:319 (+) Transcript_45580:199-1155(+)
MIGKDLELNLLTWRDQDHGRERIAIIALRSKLHKAIPTIPIAGQAILLDISCDRQIVPTKPFSSGHACHGCCAGHAVRECCSQGIRIQTLHSAAIACRLLDLQDVDAGSHQFQQLIRLDHYTSRRLIHAWKLDLPFALEKLQAHLSLSEQLQRLRHRRPSAVISSQDGRGRFLQHQRPYISLLAVPTSGSHVFQSNIQVIGIVSHPSQFSHPLMDVQQTVGQLYDSSRRRGVLRALYFKRDGKIHSSLLPFFQSHHTMRNVASSPTSQRLHVSKRRGKELVRLKQVRLSLQIPIKRFPLLIFQFEGISNSQGHFAHIG